MNLSKSSCLQLALILLSVHKTVCCILNLELGAEGSVWFFFPSSIPYNASKLLTAGWNPSHDIAGVDLVIATKQH